MAELDGTPYWSDSSTMPRYPALGRDLAVDVVVIGAGITGLTAGYLLKRAGRSVAVIDRGRCGGVDSGHTTAHVTCVTDADLAELVKQFGRDHAQAMWDAGLAAMLQIDTIVTDEGIDCGWTWVPGYKFAALDADPAKEGTRLQQEAALASELGFDATYLDAVPFVNRPGVAFEGQARFHPRKYLAGLAHCIDGGGSHVFEQTESEEVVDSPLSVKAGGHTISCNQVVIATHTPLMGKTNIASATVLQTKLYLYTSYVLGGRVAKGVIPDALFWDTASPYHYLRLDRHRDYDYAIFGGEDHKTG
jgi:glycine/D-amino acid oxidase-like deaminating enzyme